MHLHLTTVSSSVCLPSTVVSTDKQQRCKEYARAWWVANREKALVAKRLYYQAHSGEIKAKAAEYRKAHREERLAYQKAYHLAHVEEHRACSRIYSAEHKEEYKLYYQGWLVKNRDIKRRNNAASKKRHPETYAAQMRLRRARQRQAAIGVIDHNIIMVRDGMRCCICGCKVSKATLSFDHVVPLALGGAHNQANLRVAHLACNVKRGAARLPAQMLLL